MKALCHAPLWPAGHLPHEGGDYAGRLPLRFLCRAAGWRMRPRQPISPLVGEMADRPEGGNVERRASELGEWRCA
jgi:hypothetical protein